MDSTAREQALRSAILTGTAALARSLPPMFQPMAAPIVSLVQQQVASVSLPDLLEFLTEARDRIDSLIDGGTAGLVIENPPLAAHSSASRWYDPGTGRYTDRVPVHDDLLALSAAIEADVGGEEAARLAESGRYVIAYFAGQPV